MIGRPGLHESGATFDHERSQSVQFMGSKTMRLREPDRVQPKLGNAIAMLDMDVWRLRSFETVEEETKARKPQDSRHLATSVPSIGSRLARINAAGDTAMILPEESVSCITDVTSRKEPCQRA